MVEEKTAEHTVLYPPYMKPRQAAEYIGLSYDWLLTLTRKGEIPAKKINSIYRYRKVDLDEYMTPKGINDDNNKRTADKS